jgi:hypothetical protein
VSFLLCVYGFFRPNFICKKSFAKFFAIAAQNFKFWRDFHLNLVLKFLNYKNDVCDIVAHILQTAQSKNL